MDKVFFTIAGIWHYYGNEFFKPDMTVHLVKEPDNKYDTEAIQVKIKGLGVIGYVANSTKTVLGDTMSAGRIYDRFKNKAKGKVMIVTPRGVVCRLVKK